MRHGHQAFTDQIGCDGSLRRSTFGPAHRQVQDAFLSMKVHLEVGVFVVRVFWTGAGPATRCEAVVVVTRNFAEYFFLTVADTLRRGVEAVWTSRVCVKQQTRPAR